MGGGFRKNVIGQVTEKIPGRLQARLDPGVNQCNQTLFLSTSVCSVLCVGFISEWSSLSPAAQGLRSIHAAHPNENKVTSQMLVEKVDGVNLMVVTGVPGPTVIQSLLGGQGWSFRLVRSGIHQSGSLRSSPPKLLGQRVQKVWRPKADRALSDEKEWMPGRQEDPFQQPKSRMKETRGQLDGCFSHV